MKKYLTFICTALLVALLVLTFSGCNKEGAVKTAFKKAGYEVTLEVSGNCKELTDLVSTYITNSTSDDSEKEKPTQEDVIKKWKIYTCVNENRKAAFIKFPSVDDVKLALGENTFKNKSDGGYVNENCYLLTTCTIDGTLVFSSINMDALYVFKNA